MDSQIARGHSDTSQGGDEGYSAFEPKKPRVDEADKPLFPHVFFMRQEPDGAPANDTGSGSAMGRAMKAGKQGTL